MRSIAANEDKLIFQFFQIKTEVLLFSIYAVKSRTGLTSNFIQKFT